MLHSFKHSQILPICLLLLPSLCRISIAADSERDCVHVERSDGGMVVSDSAHASRVGRNILRMGGNAVDAAVATALSMAVTWPEAGNIGGGGFMMIRPSDGSAPICVDYRETAPLTMHKASFNKSDGKYSQKTVGVPGTIRGLEEAHRRYGKLPWKQLVRPAVNLARAGFHVDKFLARSINGVLQKESVKTNSKYAELRRVYGKPDGSNWIPGDRIVLPDLAKTLSLIAEDGPDAFYAGTIADQLIAEMKRGDGEISKQDLLQYRAIVRPAMQGTYKGYKIIGAQPPSSGGTCIIEALNILENYDLRSLGRYHPRSIHLIAEATRRVFADRAMHLGDPGFTEIPSFLTSKAHAKEHFESIDVSAATPSEQVAPEIPLVPESNDTTHFSIVDAAGMAVSNTYTLEASWGSRIVVTGAGFLLNNEMGDFNWFPGATNRMGQIGTAANQVAPGKRMLSSQSPTFVERNGKLVLITGSPGGRTIINTTLDVILNFIEFEMDLPTAVASPRQHHQWFPDRLDLEDLQEPPHSIAADALKRAGHQLYNRDSQGSAHSIAIDPSSGTIIGVADYRRGGRAAGVGRESIAIWDFAEPAGTELSQVQPSGSFNARWSQGIAGSRTDGQDCFRIERNAPTKPFDSYLPLNAKLPRKSKLSLIVKIASATFAGEKKNESLRIGFTHDDGAPQVAARMLLGRNGSNDITIRGEALGGGTNIEPVKVVSGNQLAKPIVMRLQFDSETRAYEIAFRNADDQTFQHVGKGEIAKGRTAKFLRLSALNDFAARNEHVAIDRIEVRAD